MRKKASINFVKKVFCSLFLCIKLSNCEGNYFEKLFNKDKYSILNILLKYNFHKKEIKSHFKYFVIETYKYIEFCMINNLDNNFQNTISYLKYTDALGHFSTNGNSKTTEPPTLTSATTTIPAPNTIDYTQESTTTILKMFNEITDKTFITEKLTQITWAVTKITTVIHIISNTSHNTNNKVTHNVIKDENIQVKPTDSTLSNHSFVNSDLSSGFKSINNDNNDNDNGDVGVYDDYNNDNKYDEDDDVKDKVEEDNLEFKNDEENKNGDKNDDAALNDNENDKNHSTKINLNDQNENNFNNTKDKINANENRISNKSIVNPSSLYNHYKYLLHHHSNQTDLTGERDIQKDIPRQRNRKEKIYKNSKEAKNKQVLRKNQGQIDDKRSLFKDKIKNKNGKTLNKSKVNLVKHNETNKNIEKPKKTTMKLKNVNLAQQPNTNKNLIGRKNKKMKSQKHTDIYTEAHTDIQKDTNTDVHKQIHTNIHKDTSISTDIHKDTDIDTQIHTNIHKDTNTDKQKDIEAYNLSVAIMRFSRIRHKNASKTCETLSCSVCEAAKCL